MGLWGAPGADGNGAVPVVLTIQVICGISLMIACEVTGEPSQRRSFLAQLRGVIPPLLRLHGPPPCSVIDQQRPIARCRSERPCRWRLAAARPPAPLRVRRQVFHPLSPCRLWASPAVPAACTRHSYQRSARPARRCTCSCLRPAAAAAQRQRRRLCRSRRPQAPSASCRAWRSMHLPPCLVRA